MTVFNPFRIAGDVVHMLSVVLLLWKIRRQKRCSGISLKTQILYAIVFTTRYLDIFTNFWSMYNTFLKVVFLSTSYYTIYLIYRKYKATYDKDHDTFQILYVIAPAAALALVFTDEYALMETLWTFSIILESVAILPQVFLLQKTREVENLTAHYIVALGAYRSLYLLNWVYRYFTEPNYRAWFVWIFGMLQTALYCDFFYYYIVSQWQRKQLVLP
ncbi:ER lumen protein-retaining receptor [Pelomyxa schiedti]|nr:ER lumen protein-retaining receptor [Pelomyxa schiedti]